MSYVIPGLLAMVLTPLVGWLADKSGRIKVLFGAGAISNVITTLIVATSTEVTPFLIGVCFASGLGLALMGGTYIAFAISTMADHTTVARDLGVTNIAFTLPFSAVAFAAPALLAIGGGAEPNYPALMLAGGVMSLLSFITMSFIQTNR